MSHPSRSNPVLFTWRFALPLSGLLLFGLFLGIAWLGSASTYSAEQFANPSFKSVWDRTDGPVSSGAVQRGWVWGPEPGKSLTEPFAGLPGNSHAVQYFDKGRMEINNPNADKNDLFYVSNGLLAVELISGLMQTGTASYERRAPAAINLASDADDPTAPTYQSFNGVSNVPGAPNERRKASQVGEIARTAIDRQGLTLPWPEDHPDYGVRIAYFEPATGHNIPDVFWSYLNQQATIIQNGQTVRGPLFYPWFAQTGYPISEAYWAYVKVEGRYTDVLIQAYERRVLTYVPGLPAAFRVQMGNIGMHYYEWRYLKAGATPASGLPIKANISVDGIAYRKSLTDLNGNYATLTNRDEQSHSLSGWWLDSPKWSYVDRFYFPNGVTIAAGATLRVHAGPGTNTATDIYMFRTSLMWEGQPYDLAVLYDNYGREVSRYFPASAITPVLTVPASSPTSGRGTPTATPAGTQTSRGTATATATAGAPPPQATSPATIQAATATATPGR